MTALPRLVDARTLGQETGLKRTAVEAIFRQLPKVTVPGVRKTFVRRADVARLLEENTRAA